MTCTLNASGSTEAEFVAAFSAAKAAQHIRLIPQEMGSPQDRPTETHIDSQAALQIVNDNQALTIRARHLDARFFSLQDWQEEGSTSVVHVAGVLSLSDDSTKALACCCLHARHCRRMMGRFD